MYYRLICVVEHPILFKSWKELCSIDMIKISTHSSANRLLNYFQFLVHKMAQLIRALVADSASLETWVCPLESTLKWKERTNSTDLSLDLQMCAAVCTAHKHIYTIGMANTILNFLYFQPFTVWDLLPWTPWHRPPWEHPQYSSRREVGSREQITSDFDLQDQIVFPRGYCDTQSPQLGRINDNK